MKAPRPAHPEVRIMNLSSALVWGIALGVLLIALKVYGVIQP